MEKIIVTALLIFSCTDGTHFGRFCPAECYSGNTQTKNIGECRSGKPICDEKTNVVECEGEVLPSEETCDGRDQDCNNLSDDMIYPLHSYDFPPGKFGLAEYPCLSLGECRNGRTECVNGSWKCIYPPTVELNSDGNVAEKETLCDQKDGSCNGRTDEDIIFDPPYCFDGTIFQATNPPCSPGVWICNDGVKTCTNQVLPTLEICGDQIDQDCSGIPDDTTIVLNTDFDIVFLVDTSGSMAYTISSVAGALDAYSSQFDDNEHYRFALVLMAAPVGTLVQIDTNFTDFTSIRSRIQSLQDDGSGAEASLDAMLEICQQSNPLLLSWRPEAKKLIFTFTDELPQTYVTPQTTYQMVSDTCIASQTTLVIWSENEPEFRPIAENAGGVYFELINDWEIMFEEMNSIIFMFCE